MSAELLCRIIYDCICVKEHFTWSVTYSMEWSSFFVEMCWREAIKGSPCRCSKNRFAVRGCGADKSIYSSHERLNMEGVFSFILVVISLLSSSLTDSNERIESREYPVVSAKLATWQGRDRDNYFSLGSLSSLLFPYSHVLFAHFASCFPSSRALKNSEAVNSKKRSLYCIYTFSPHKIIVLETK